MYTLCTQYVNCVYAYGIIGDFSLSARTKAILASAATSDGILTLGVDRIENVVRCTRIRVRHI